jgi:hypothetical protein
VGIFARQLDGRITGASPRWRKGYQAVLDRLVKALYWRLELDQLKFKIGSIEEQLRNLIPTATAWEVTSWIEQATLSETPLVSIILATRNRHQLLRRAVASISAQDYPRWEIILVDDGSTDQTPEVVGQLCAELGGDRLHAIRISQGGVCAARNHGLAAAQGTVIAYLDDDNTMHRLWLKSVVWAFSQRPDIDVVYGGVMIDDFGRLNCQSAGRLPSFHLNPFDETALRDYNLADIGAIAHRKLPDARVDESLHGFGDWDLLFRLTRAKAPLVLPVLACYYTTSAPNRLSDQSFFPDEMRLVRERLRR